MKRTTKKLCIFLAVIMLLSQVCISAFALSWDGSSSGGGGNTTSAGANGYAIASDGDDNCIGYRFAVVNKAGNTKTNINIDVFRKDNYYATYEYNNGYRFNYKYNKKQLINNQNSGFSTSHTMSYCYLESNCNFKTSLPNPDGMKTWQNNSENLKVILSLLKAGSLEDLKNGDKILVEPIYSVRLEGVWHSLTATEIAIYGKHILGAYSDGGASYTSESWGFISNYTNKHYPNKLYTPDGQSLWDGVSASSSRLTFYNIINKGYGVGIAYTETKSDFSPSLAVKVCEAWPGSSVGTRNNNHYGTSNGNTFSNWTYGHGYPKSGDKIWYSVNFPAESENCYVKQTVWIGNSVKTRKVWSNSNTWYDVSLDPTTVPKDKSYITVKARVDWIESDGTIKKHGAEKSFYIPIRPTVNRYQVSAVNYSGNVQAYSGMDGSSGKIYVGQKVYFKYKYTSENTWASSNNFAALSQKYNGSSWVMLSSVNKNDVDASKVSISSKSSVEKTSVFGYLRVPSLVEGSTQLKFKMTSQWNADTAHTTETSYYNIPVVKADVALYEIKLIGEDGCYVKPSLLTIGEKVTVQYVYMNNTDCTVFVEGFNNDETKIDGVYEIAPNEKIAVNGYSFVVPNTRHFKIWGGVYLEGAGLKNTENETVWSNNDKVLNCTVNHPISITPIEPNAPYREGTDVISSYWLVNNYSDDYTPDNNVTVFFEIKLPDGKTYRNYSISKCIVPGNNKNLYTIRWKVPTGLNSKDITIKAHISDDGNYNEVVKTYHTIPYEYYTTPDTQFEKEKPADFEYSQWTASTPSAAKWWQWSYVNGEFVKINYGLALHTANTATITPSTGSTATQTDGVWTMKSGYGISIAANANVKGIARYTIPRDTEVTDVQYVYAGFPEFKYKSGTNEIKTLFNVDDVVWQFRYNSKYEGRTHFTPLYFPDKDYIVKVTYSDLWTPSGMITASCATNKIKISGSAYDDWTVGRK